MVNYIERTFLKMEELMKSKGYLPNCYIYRDSYDGDFIVWIHSLTGVLDERFRDKHLRTALRKAYKFVKEL